MNPIDYHSKRAMQEFHAGMAATNREASDAHLRLSSMHMAHVDQLAHGRLDAPAKPRPLCR
jgi:hypothetical protein